MGLDQDHDRDMILQRLEKIKEKQNGEIHQVTTKSMIYALFSDANSSVCAMWISNLINLVILASTFGFVAETDPTLRGESYSTMWFSIECICVGLFTIDFVVRAVTCPQFSGQAKEGEEAPFASDIMNWVDFIAIVPFYIELMFMILKLDAGALSNLRVIRVLRLARVLKIIAKSGDSGPSLEDDGDEDVGAVIGEIVSNSGGALVIPLYFMLLSLIVFASVQYYIEKVKPILVIHTCPDFGEESFDLGDCTRELPHGPYESPCPVVEWQGEISMDHGLKSSLGDNFGHPCTIESILFPDGLPEEDTKTPYGVIKEGEQIDCSSLSKPSLPMGRRNNSMGVEEESCRVASYYEYPDRPMGMDHGSIAATTSSDMFPSIPHAMWWCIVTMTTVGYGDKYPISWMGQVVGVMTASMGIFFISMPLAIVGSSFANSCQKLQYTQDQKDAVVASEDFGYGSLSFLAKSHAPIMMANLNIERMMSDIQNIIEEDVGVFEKDECADMIDLIFDLREAQTMFSRQLQKELFLARVKKNMNDREKAEAAQDVDGEE